MQCVSCPPDRIRVGRTRLGAVFAMGSQSQCQCQLWRGERVGDGRLCMQCKVLRDNGGSGAVQTSGTIVQSNSNSNGLKFLGPES